mgnify:CR=1 FL=1
MRFQMKAMASSRKTSVLPPAISSSRRTSMRASGRLAPTQTTVVPYDELGRLAWDQEHVYFPNRRGLKARARGMVLSALRSWDAASAARVNLYVANSTFVARRVRTYYGRDAEVIHPPVDTDAFKGALASDCLDGVSYWHQRPYQSGSRIRGRDNQPEPQQQQA